MPMPDLPIELWMKILSYHPRRFRRKMIGVNRALFELALDDIFEEIQLVYNDNYTLFVFTELQHVNIAKRVQRLVIRPCFLPEENQPPVPVQGIIQRQLRSLLTSMKIKNNSLSHQDQMPTSDTLLSTVRRHIVLCPNIRELTIIIKGSKLTSSFKSFFKSLWLPDSIAPRIRKLTIECTPAMLSELLRRFSRFPINLEDFSITFLASHPTDDAITPHLFLFSFLATFQDNLVSFSTAGHLIPHLANLLKAAPKFMKLRRFEVSPIFNIQDVQQVEQLNKFIARHSETLEHLILKPRLRENIPLLSKSLFLHWISLDKESGPGQTFSQLILPNLQILELGNRDDWIDSIVHNQVIFPNLINATPNLISLSLTDTNLPAAGVSKLLARLPNQSGICFLEKLQMRVDILSLELMDLFVQELPRLKSLELYVHVSTVHLLDGSSEQFKFCEQIQRCKYPSWGLKYLRITSAAYCTLPHPNTFIMKAVAESLSNDLVLDFTYDCLCNTPDSGSIWTVVDIHV